MTPGALVEPTFATHYELLGVEPMASATEVRHAYRRAAREAHPDRHGEESSRRMADINEAWRVLGDPTRRRDYDAMLHLARSVVSASVWGAPTIGATAPNRAASERRRFGWRFVLSMELLAVAVVIVSGVAAAMSSTRDRTLRNGDCVVLVADRPPAEVACAAPHDAVVDRVIPFGRACPGATVPVRNRTTRACVIPIVGAAPDLGVLRPGRRDD